MADEPERWSEGWLRQCSLPEEWILANCPSLANNPRRHFSSQNVIDLVDVRRQRAKLRGGGNGGDRAA